MGHLAIENCRILTLFVEWKEEDGKEDAEDDASAGKRRRYTRYISTLFMMHAYRRNVWFIGSDLLCKYG